MQEPGNATRPSSAGPLQRPRSAGGILRPSSAARRVLVPIQHKGSSLVAVDVAAPAEGAQTAHSLPLPLPLPKGPPSAGSSVPISSILPQMTPELIQRIARERPAPSAWTSVADSHHVPSLPLRPHTAPSPTPHASLREDPRTPSARPSSATGEYRSQSAGSNRPASLKPKSNPKFNPKANSRGQAKSPPPPKDAESGSLEVLFETKALNTPLHSAIVMRPKSGKSKVPLHREERSRSPTKSPIPFSTRRSVPHTTYSSYSRQPARSPTRNSSPSPTRSLVRTSPTKNTRRKKYPKKNKKTKSDYDRIGADGDANDDAEIEASKRAQPKHIRDKADYLCCLSKCNFEEVVRVIQHFRNFGRSINNEQSQEPEGQDDKELVSHLSYESFTRYVEETYRVDDIYFSKAIFYLLSRLDYEENSVKSPKDRSHWHGGLADADFGMEKSGNQGGGSLPSVLYEKPESKDYDKIAGSGDLKVTIEQFCAFLGKVLHGSLIELSDTCFDMMDLNHKEYLSNTDAFRTLMCLCEDDELTEILAKLERAFSGGDLISKPTFLKMMRMNPELINKIRGALLIPFEDMVGDAHEADQELEDIFAMNRALNQDIKMRTYTRKGEYLMAWKDGKLVELIGEFKFDSLPDKEFGIFFLQDPELFYADSAYRKACVIEGIRHRGVAVMVGIRTADRQPDIISLVFHLSLFSPLSASRWYDAHKSDLPPRRWALGLRIDQDDDDDDRTGPPTSSH